MKYYPHNESKNTSSINEKFNAFSLTFDRDATPNLHTPHTKNDVRTLKIIMVALGLSIGGLMATPFIAKTIIDNFGIGESTSFSPKP